MNKNYIIKNLIKKYDIDINKAKTIVDIFFESIKDAVLEGKNIEIRGFGGFKKKYYKSMKFVNPINKKNELINNRVVCKFHASKILNNRINEKL